MADDSDPGPRRARRVADWDDWSDADSGIDSDDTRLRAWEDVDSDPDRTVVREPWRVQRAVPSSAPRPRPEPAAPAIDQYAWLSASPAEEPPDQRERIPPRPRRAEGPPQHEPTPASRPPAAAAGAGRRVAQPQPAQPGGRWAVAVACVAILLPVAVLSMLRVTSGTDAGRIATRPNMALFAKPIDAARLPASAGDFDRQSQDAPRALPRGQRESAFYQRGDERIYVVIQDAAVPSLGDYETTSGLHGTERFGSGVSCGRMDTRAQCVSLLRGGLVIAIAADPAVEPGAVAEFLTDLYAELPEA